MSIPTTEELLRLLDRLETETADDLDRPFTYKSKTVGIARTGIRSKRYVPKDGKV